MRATLPFAKRRQQGQTLIMALIILGVLLVLGFVFLGIVNRSIASGGRAQQRSVATDLAEAGVRFAHGQMLTSEAGADWNPAPTAPLNAGDPDFSWLRPAAGGSDFGGPDGLGAFTRVDFSQGRALIRVRYAPSDANIFDITPNGPLRTPGRARSYLMVESIGRPGRVRANDPTTTLQRTNIESRKVVAFVSIGIIEHARFITNRDRVARAADLGVPVDLGARFATAANANVPVQVPLQLGTSGTLFNFANGQPTLNPVEFGGSLFSNAALRVFGEVRANLNVPLGDGIRTSQSIVGADSSSSLVVRRADIDRATGNFLPTQVATLTNNTNPSLDSNNPNFATVGGVLRDGVLRIDRAGFSRGTGSKEPPSIQRIDPDTRTNRYVQMTRNSGRITTGGNGGQFGHGRGVYVNNVSDRQVGSDEDGRALGATNESLVYDWLNPNNGQPNSGWRGNFYVPRGATMQLLPDGFLITRDPTATRPIERTWRMENGAPSLRPGANAQTPGPGDLLNSSSIRYRLGQAGGRLRIINSFTVNPATGTVIDVNASNPPFEAGQPFNGVVFFEGNVRVRGVIPTDVQLTLVSNATIYIEGSITKGVVTPGGSRLTRPSRSTLMLMAKDYVAVNPTQFFGPAWRSTLTEANETSGGVAWNPLRMRSTGGELGFRSELLLNPEVTGPNANNPASWVPYLTSYREFGSVGTGGRLDPALLISHTMDDGAGAASFFSLDVNPGLQSPAYQFPLSRNNAATPIYLDLGAAPGSFVPIYGLGGQNWQRYPKFETTSFPIVTPTFAFATTTLQLTGGTSAIGAYTLRVQDTNDFVFRPNFIGSVQANDTLIAKAAIVPQDVRIEAAIFAEEGSFFVIPGNWYNPNPNDRRDAFLTAVESYVGQGLSPAAARQAALNDRQDNYGASPETPFYGEPLAVRVQVVGAISENMPPPISQQAEWQRKWGWIPREIGGSGRLIPAQWVPAGIDLNTTPYVPNLIVSYDPVLATGRIGGFTNVRSQANDDATLIRQDAFGRALPPMPSLPVSPTLAYFGEVNP